MKMLNRHKCKHLSLHTTKWLNFIRCVFCGQTWEKQRMNQGTRWYKNNPDKTTKLKGAR